MKTFVSPCNKLGYIPMTKIASTSMNKWLSSAGWTIKESDPGIPYFFLIRSPSQRLLSSVIECVYQTLNNHNISITKQTEMLEQGKIIQDVHTLSICERLYHLNIDYKNLICINAEKHLHLMINLLFKHYNVTPIDNPIPVLNQTDKSKSTDIISLAKKIIQQQYRHFHLGFDIDSKIYNLINETTKYYRLEYDYIRQTKKQPNFERVVDLPSLQNLLKDVVKSASIQTLLPE